jgi:hypothetical protein
LDRGPSSSNVAWCEGTPLAIDPAGSTTKMTSFAGGDACASSTVVDASLSFAVD